MDMTVNYQMDIGMNHRVDIEVNYQVDTHVNYRVDIEGPLQNQTLFIHHVNAMSLSYVKSMYWVFKSYVMRHTEALFKFYDIVMSFAIYFDKNPIFLLVK